VAAAFAAIAAKLKSTKSDRIGAIAGDLATVEEMFALKELMGKLGATSIDCRQDGSALDPSLGRASYLFNATIAGIDQADGIMIIGANPRKEAPVLNARIRKRWRASNLKIGVIGEKADLTYDYAYLGAGPETLATFVNHEKAKLERQLWLIGQGVLARPDGAALLAMAAKAAVAVGAIKDGWNGFSVLHTAASRVGGLDIGFVPRRWLSATQMAKAGALDVLFNLGADEIEIAPARSRSISARMAMPGRTAPTSFSPARPTRKSPAFSSTPKAACRWRREPAFRRAMRARTGRFCALSPTCSARSFPMTRCPRCAPHCSVPTRTWRGSIRSRRKSADIEKLAGWRSPDKAPFRSAVADFYLTNPIARASATMAECSGLARGQRALTAAE